MQASSLNRVAGGVVAAILSAGGLAAQQPVTVQWTPRLGAVVRTVTSSRGTMVFREVNEAGQAIGDSVAGEMTSLSGITHRIVDQRAGEVVVEVRYDSLRTRVHLMGQEWKDELVSGTGETAQRVAMDLRLRPSQGVDGGLAADPVSDGGIASWHGVELPDHPVVPGETWTVTTVYRLPAQLSGLLEIVIKDSIIAAATVRLDSVASRPADSLMFFTVQETLPPMTLPVVDAGDSGTVELAGAQAASLVWSTGWQAFVSGASQARVVGQLRSGKAGAAPRLARINWAISTRLQVRL
jgi:hypothetical protein